MMSQQKLTKSGIFKLIFVLHLVLALSFSSNVKALQLKNTHSVFETVQTLMEDSVYSYAEKMPEFPGGEKALVSFLSKTINFPEEAAKKNEFGKVFVQFIINKAGKVKSPKVIKGISSSLDNEALRVISLLPDWTPGEQNGTKVSVYRIIPILFQNAQPKDSDAFDITEKTVVVIDNVKMPATFNASILNLSKMVSATILKPFPKEAKSKLISKYGKQAENGVILITSNKDDIYYALADSLSNQSKDELSGCKDPAVMPEFPGGNEKLFSYIADSIQYPFVPKQLKTQGKVIVRFLVDITGKISNARVMKSLDYFLDKEAVRVISNMPAWIPGAKCDKKLSIQVTMPVIFKLELPNSEKIWEKNAKTIVLLNGERLPASFNLEWINYTALSSYQVLQPTSKDVIKKLVSKYGRDAANGVVLISTAK